MSATNHAASVCSTRGEMQSQANPIQTRTGSVGRPSGMVPGGAQTTEPNASEIGSISDLGSDANQGSENDAETAGLVSALLAAGLAPLTIAASLGIDEDTLRRWRRGVEASPLARRAMRLLLTVRHIAPSLLPGVWAGSVADLTDHLDSAQMRWVSLEEIERRRRTDRLAKEFASAPKRPSRWASIEGAVWRDGAEGGGL